MKFKEIFLASALFFSSVLAFPQDKLSYGIKTEGGGFPSTNSSLNLSKKEIDFSFLLGLYSMNFNQVDDTTYNETKHFLFKNESFNYSKGSGYIFSDYSACRGKPREIKKSLENTHFNEKYKTLPELFGKFENGEFKDGDSLHFFLMGVSYSLRVKRRDEEDRTIYSANLSEAVKFEPGDDFHFSYPIEIVAREIEGKQVLSEFSTKFLNVKKSKEGSLEGRLKRE